jgi:hypothetical protein
MNERPFGIDEAREHGKHVLLSWYEPLRSMPDALLPLSAQIDLSSTLLQTASLLGPVELPLKEPRE